MTSMVMVIFPVTIVMKLIMAVMIRFVMKISLTFMMGFMMACMMVLVTREKLLPDVRARPMPHRTVH